MAKTIKLRHTRTFITMFISSLFYIFPKFFPKFASTASIMRTRSMSFVARKSNPSSVIRMSHAVPPMMAYCSSLPLNHFLRQYRTILSTAAAGAVLKPKGGALRRAGVVVLQNGFCRLYFGRATVRALRGKEQQGWNTLFSGGLARPGSVQT